MVSKKIVMPNGELRTYYCGEGQTWGEIIENVILPYWQSYCDNNWISPNHEAVYAPEKRVKWFLDRLGWILIEGENGIESEYKNMVHKVREVPVTECPAGVSDLLYSDRHVTSESESDNERFEVLIDKLDEIDKRKKRTPSKPRKKTMFEKIEALRAASPGADMTWCIVDEMNTFQYRGGQFRIPMEMKGYTEDRRMDRVLAVETADRLVFYDQTAENMFIAT